MSKFTTDIIPMLENIKAALGVCQDGPGTQQEPSQDNKVSTSAAKAKLDALSKKSMAGLTKVTKLAGTGAKR